MTQGELIAPQPGIQTHILAVLHEYGLLQARAIAVAVAAAVEVVEAALAQLFALGLVARGTLGWRSTGVWTPGRPSSERPAL